MRAKHLRYFLLMFAAIAAAFVLTPSQRSWADDGQDYGVGLARVSYITGDTLFKSADTDEWAALSPNFTLRDGDSLWAGDESQLEVFFQGGAKAWLNYQSGLDITALRSDRDGDVYQVALVSGEASFYARNFEVAGSVFQVDAPNASVMAYGKAYFRMSALSDGTTQIGVRSGAVEVESQDGTRTTVRKGDLLEVYPDGGSRIMPLPSRDNWDDWVASRIKTYNKKYQSAQYLPPEVRDYAYEFDEGGRWVDYPEYGRVWAPTVEVGWTPYSNGRWVWIAGDYVWLPYDPWYAPFHFGRWSFITSIGWCWVPPLPGFAFWSPGYVGWASGGSSVFWVPLAPGEVYYGWGNYGSHNINAYRTRDFSITNVYVNSRVTNSVVAVDRDDFIHGRTRRAEMDRDRNPFLHKRVGGARITGAPPIKEFKPERDMMFPKPGVRPSERSLPPRQVEEMTPYMKGREAVRGGKGSAFKPGAERPEFKPQGRQGGLPGSRREEPGIGQERQRPSEVRPGGRFQPEERAPGFERGRPAERAPQPEAIPPGRQERKDKRNIERGGGIIAPEVPGRIEPGRVEPGRERGRVIETPVAPPVPEVQRPTAPERGRGQAPEGVTIEPQRGPSERGQGRGNKGGRVFENPAPAPQAVPQAAPEIQRAPAPERGRVQAPEGVTIEPQKGPSERGQGRGNKGGRTIETPAPAPQTAPPVPEVQRAPAPKQKRERIIERPVVVQPFIQKAAPQGEVAPEAAPASPEGEKGRHEKDKGKDREGDRPQD